VVADAEARGERAPTHFGPDSNELAELEGIFKTYSETGHGKRRFYLHNDEEAAPYGQQPGTFTPWENLPEHTDLLFYEGLHGAYVGDDADVAQHVDLAIGVVPVVNLEWIQKIHRDTEGRGYSVEAVTQTILRRMHDYVHHICPQFSRTHINFQRVPIVDTSNPFVARDIPTLDESMVVIRFRDPHGVDFPYLLTMIQGSFMSRPNIMVVPGGKMELAMQLVLSPIMLELMEKKWKRSHSK
jgi:phosphoribulokinase